ncbi:MAG: bifunctional phosphoribosylaminoimidazolecarboxamide formyltransferase/IMP cyclohydrolase [Deltaproteobacteria bacterium]|nr:bifunctional phosphoribosylaminoimidazolecarboxamide formyltransferase/IMP cyclohydrolase [Deltaproteobacteria bacterium]
MLKKRYALISVYDKTGVVELATHLEIDGYTVIATGNTYNVLKSAGITDLKRIDEITNFPEIMEGRVKTLHPAIFGGILSIRDNENHIEDMKKNNISPIDFVVVNLYPFKEMKDKDITFEEKLEFIDIGGVSLIRAAAKNFRHVSVATSPACYPDIIEFLKNKQEIPQEIKKVFAYEAFKLTAEYDSEISNFLGSKKEKKDVVLKGELNLNLKKLSSLRYGENPHQKAAFYEAEFEEDFKGIAANEQKRDDYPAFKKISGKDISYNNLLDIDSTFNIIRDFYAADDWFSVIVKHTNPCGAALSKTSLKDAFLKARKTDEISSYGGIIGFNKKVDKETALEIKPFFVEIILAPGYSGDALEILKTKKNTIIVEYFTDYILKRDKFSLRSASGGVLVQEKDDAPENTLSFKTVTDKKADDYLLNDLIFAWKIAKHVKSNAIVYAKDCATLGIGAGQMSRIDSAKFAYQKMHDSYGDVRGFVMASDGFFPFKDSVEYAGKIGVIGIIEPGGSIRDDEVTSEADKLNIPMIFTNIRHFKH